MYKQLGQGPSAYWVPGASTETATGLGYVPTSGAIRGAWECACPTETPTSRRIPLSGVFDDPKKLLMLGGAAVALWWFLRGSERRKRKNPTKSFMPRPWKVDFRRGHGPSFRKNRKSFHTKTSAVTAARAFVRRAPASRTATVFGPNRFVQDFAAGLT